MIPEKKYTVIVNIKDSGEGIKLKYFNSLPEAWSYAKEKSKKLGSDHYRETDYDGFIYYAESRNDDSVVIIDEIKQDIKL